MDFLILFLVLAIGFYSGYTFREAVARRRAELILNALMQDTEEETNSSTVKIKIEKHKETFFVYDFETERFITQANTRDELEANLAKLYPGKKFGCTKENLSEIGFIS